MGRLRLIAAAALVVTGVAAALVGLWLLSPAAVLVAVGVGLVTAGLRMEV